MKDLQVYRILNKKLKLCERDLCIKTIGAAPISFLAGIGAKTIAQPFYADDFLTFLISSFITLGSLNFMMMNMKDPKMKLYEQIKKDLDNGTNRFENIGEDDFDTELQKYPTFVKTK